MTPEGFRSPDRRSQRASTFGRICILFFASLAATPLLALDPAKDLTQFCVRNWNAEDGLAQNSVNAIAQTPDGYLWLATQEGATRFDGVRFTPVVSSDHNHLTLHHHAVSAFLVSRDGALWAGGIGGLIRYQRGVTTVYGKSKGLKDENTWSLAEGPDGSIWVATYSAGVARFKDGRFTSITTADGLPSNSVWSLWTGRDGALWIGTNGGGVSRYRDGMVTTFTARDGLPHDVVWAVYQDREGTVWVGTNRGLCRIRDGKLTAVAEVGKVPIKAIFEDREGAIWIGTDGRGLIRYHEGRFATFRPGEALATAEVIAFYEDPEGSLWVGTSTAGLFQLHSGKFSMIGVPEGLLGDEVWTLRQARDGAMWIGTNSGISLVRNGTVSTVGGPGGNSSMIRSLAEGADGTMWFGTYGGLVSYREGKFRTYHVADGLSHEIARVVFADRSGNIWIGTRGGGLNKFRDGVFTVYTTANGLASDVVLDIAEDRDGSLWIATYGGVSRFRNGVFTNFTTRNGLSSEATRVIYHDGAAHWIGTYGGGLNRVKFGRVSAIQQKDGLFDDVVLSVTDDQLGHLWMSSNRGIFEVSKQELNDFADGKISAVHSVAYDSADGMRKSECNSGAPSSVRAADGRLWFATVAGVAVIDPARISRNATPAAVWNEEVIADGKTVAAADGEIRLEPGNHTIEIHYTVTSFLAPKKVAFRYRLRGLSDAWIDAGNRRAAFYTNLPPGRYIFEVMGSNNDGLWSAVRNPIAIEVRAAFFQTRWFWIACALAAILAVPLGFMVRLRMLAQRERLLAKLVDEQTAALSAAKQAAESAVEVSNRLAQRKRLILNSAAEGIFGVDSDGVSTFVNPSAAQMLGWSVEEIVGSRLHAIIHAGEEECVREEECVICSDRVDPPARVGRSEFRRRDGRTFPVEYTVSAMIGESGERDGVVVTFRDVTEQRAIERMKDEFVSTVSHELRTPLTSIRGALGLLSSGMLRVDGPKAQRMLDVAVTNTDRLVRLINDILDQERINSGKLQLVLQPADASELMTQAAEGLQGFADQAGVAIFVEPVDARLSVDCDRIVQTLMNLLSNAIKFSPRGTMVAVGGRIADGMFVFHVTDQGRGIPPDKVEIIFERFRQVDASDSRQKGGTGLGLAICRSIVQAHGGRIWAESSANGSVFRFSVPLEATECGEAISA